MANQIIFTGDVKHAEKGVARLEERVRKLTEDLKEAGRAGKRTGKKTTEAFAVSRLTSYATGLVSVTAAIGGVSRAYEVWLRNLREISTEAKAAANEMVALAAIQEGGARREAVIRSGLAGARHGVSRAEAFNTVQIMQSTRGDFESGLAAAEAIFAATRLGISAEQGTEAELFAASPARDEPPGRGVRMLYVAGNLSGRTPAQLAASAGALGAYEDSAQGMAVAAILSSSVSAEQLRTFTEKAGLGLSPAANKRFIETLAGLGVAPDADPITKLRALETAGIDTLDETLRAGLELRQAKAVAWLVPAIDKLESYTTAIKAKAVPGVFTQGRMGIEEEIAETRQTREIETIAAWYRLNQSVGPQAMEALKVEKEQRIRGLAMQRLGHREGLLGLDFFDEEGRASVFAGMRHEAMYGRPLFSSDPQEKHRIGEPFARPPTPLEAEIQKIRDELAATAPAASQAAMEEAKRVAEDQLDEAKKQTTTLEAISRSLGGDARYASPMAEPESVH